MQEPYETLLAQYKDHPVVGKWLQEDMPKWSDIWTQAMPSLSSSERVMFSVALTLYNGYSDCRLRDIFAVDSSNQKRILKALKMKIRPSEE